MAIDLGGTLQGIFDAYRSRKITTDEFMQAVRGAYVESGEDSVSAQRLADDYLNYARTGQSLNGPVLPAFDNPLESVAQQPVYGGVAGGGGSMTPAVDTPNNPQNITEQGGNDPFAAYIRQRGLPAVGGSPSQNWQTRQYNPLFSTWQAQSTLNPELTPSMWSDYIQGAGANISPQQTRQQAANLFQQARGGNQQEFGRAMGGTEENRGIGNDLKNLLSAALESRFATPVAQRMTDWIPSLATQYQADTTGTGQKLLDYLNQRLRLR